MKFLSILCCPVVQVSLFNLEDNLTDTLKLILERPGYKKSPSHFVHFLLDKISHIPVKVHLRLLEKLLLSRMDLIHLSLSL